jgi:hypothetical protein
MKRIRQPADGWSQFGLMALHLHAAAICATAVPFHLAAALYQWQRASGGPDVKLTTDGNPAETETADHALAWLRGEKP